jgi:hypothetical protein
MIFRLAVIALGLAAASGAQAQTTITESAGSTGTIGDLVKDGYEIKAAVPNGSSFVVFLQKEQSAYACEFVSVTSSRCKAIK